MDGYRPSGSRFALEANPMLPVIIAPMSVRISPKRLLPTTTSKTSGFLIKSIAAASTSKESVVMFGNSAETLSNAWSQTNIP